MLLVTTSFGMSSQRKCRTVRVILYPVELKSAHCAPSMETYVVRPVTTGAQRVYTVGTYVTASDLRNGSMSASCHLSVYRNLRPNPQ